MANAKSAFTVAAALVMASAMAYASPAGRRNSSQKSVDLYVFNQAQVPGGPMLKPGDYTMRLSQGSSAPLVAFYHNEKLVGHAPAHLVRLDKAPDQTSIHYLFRGQDDPTISEISVKGWTQKLVFGQSS
ncbi:MAG: hypothetical protein ACRD3D_11320 [Terriglobia bacterium]